MAYFSLVKEFEASAEYQKKEVPHLEGAGCTRDVIVTDEEGWLRFVRPTLISLAKSHGLECKLKARSVVIGKATYIGIILPLAAEHAAKGVFPTPWYPYRAIFVDRDLLERESTPSNLVKRAKAASMKFRLFSRAREKWPATDDRPIKADTHCLFVSSREDWLHRIRPLFLIMAVDKGEAFSVDKDSFCIDRLHYHHALPANVEKVCAGKKFTGTIVDNKFWNSEQFPESARIAIESSTAKPNVATLDFEDWMLLDKQSVVLDALIEAEKAIASGAAQ